MILATRFAFIARKKKTKNKPQRRGGNHPHTHTHTHTPCTSEAYSRLLVKKCRSLNYIDHGGQLTVEKAPKFQQPIHPFFTVKKVPTKGLKCMELSGRQGRYMKSA